MRIALAVLLLLSGCAGFVPGAVIHARNDLDNVVSTKGLPVSISEGFIGGRFPRHHVQVNYQDGMYVFQTDAAKTYFVLLTSQTTAASSGQPQQRLPDWFRARYPTLDWSKVPQ
jgi:hypothetical protein